MPKNILEREIFHAGKTIIQAGNTSTNAYIIQEGAVVSYTSNEKQKIETGRYGPGSIIGETNLMVDEPAQLNYEALVDTTVVVIVRQDYEKKLTKIDKTVLQIIKALIKKLKKLETDSINKALEAQNIDNKAREIVGHLLRDMTGERKERYEQILQPHFNIMCRSLEELKKEERYKKQKQALAEKVKTLAGDEQPEDASEMTEFEEIDSFSNSVSDDD